MRQILTGVAFVAMPVLAAWARRADDDVLDRLVDMVPVLVLRLARRRLPAANRDDLYQDWYADLDAWRHDLTGRRLTRLRRCTRFSLGLLRTGRTIAVDYRGLSQDLPPDVRLGIVEDRLCMVRDVGPLPWLSRRDGLRPLALYVRDLLRLPALAFTADERGQLVAAAAITGKFCVDDRDERLGQELADAARPHADHLDPDHPAVLQLDHTAGYATLQLGNHDGAGLILGDVHRRLVAALGAHHPATLEAQRLRFWNLQEQGRLQDAEHGLATILWTLEWGPRTDHAQRLHVMCMLGWVLCRQAMRDMVHGLEERAERQFDLSEATYRDVIDGRERLFGPDHHDTLDARHSLGKVLFVRGDWHRAHDVLHHVAADRQRCTDSAHPDTLESRKYAALAGALLGGRREAMSELGRVLTTQTQTQGPAHPNTVDTRRWLDALTQEKM